MKPLELLPAIDIKNGKVTQLSSAGGKWIHFVDLDTACVTGDNTNLIKQLVLTSQGNIQLSGGIVNQKRLDSGKIKQLAPSLSEGVKSAR